ncbi:hypothetical protein J132_02969 [Termitomyces sp. J132]|nr:hypothetical protein J132_02969 [Termitomyces sp. J132]
MHASAKPDYTIIIIVKYDYEYDAFLFSMPTLYSIMPARWRNRHSGITFASCGDYCVVWEVRFHIQLHYRPPW